MKRTGMTIHGLMRTLESPSCKYCTPPHPRVHHSSTLLENSCWYYHPVLHPSYPAHPVVSQYVSDAQPSPCSYSMGDPTESGSLKGNRNTGIFFRVCPRHLTSVAQFSRNHLPRILGSTDTL